MSSTRYYEWKQLYNQANSACFVSSALCNRKKEKKSFVRSSVVLSTVNYEHLEKNPVKAQLTSFLSLYSNDRLM